MKSRRPVFGIGFVIFAIIVIWAMVHVGIIG
jgi:hypothetical protein